jgi:hypothetical protein
MNRGAVSPAPYFHTIRTWKAHLLTNHKKLPAAASPVQFAGGGNSAGVAASTSCPYSFFMAPWMGESSEIRRIFSTAIRFCGLTQDHLGVSLAGTGSARFSARAFSRHCHQHIALVSLLYRENI